MQPQRLVEFGNHGRWQLSKACPEAPDANRSDLFDLGFGRACQPGGAGLQELCYPGSSNQFAPCGLAAADSVCRVLDDFAMSWTRRVSLVSISSCLVRTRLSHRWKGRLTSRVLLRPSPGTPARPTSSTTRMPAPSRQCSSD
jgi:hypothetical protein